MDTTVLIVHDDAAFFEKTKAALVAAIPGCEVIGAISAPRALGMARQHKPDVVIADGDLEGMDGYAFTAELKGDAELGGIPVLIVANDPSEASALKARQVGAAGHLPASVDSQTLVQKISALTGAAAQTPAAPAGAPAAPVEPLGAGVQAPMGAAPAPAAQPAAPAAAATPGYGAPQDLPQGYGAPQVTTGAT
ncbi:MAG: response regulator, partial [Coriobacteriia bacterium]|nr:response regulator [Coriobacteriia bacterium]